MKIDLVFLIVLGIVVAYVFALYKIETMADVSSLDQIKEAVRQIYLADVEAIRNLSEVATKLQAGGLTVPGQLKVVDKISTNGLDPVNIPDGWKGGLRILDGYASGTMGFGPDGKKINAYLNSKGELKLGSWTIKENANGHLIFIKDGTKYDNDYSKIPQDTGFIALSQDGNMWSNRSSGRGWVADNLGQTVKYNDIINITSSKNNITKYISTSSTFSAIPGLPGLADLSLSSDKKNGAFKIEKI